MKYRVTVLPRAQQDITETHNFIAKVQEQPLAAERWLEGIEKAIKSPSSLATRGKVIREQEYLDSEPELLQVLFHSHRIIYTVTGDHVEVVHIRRGSRKDLEESDV